MTMVADPTKAAAMKAQLENRGFRVVEMTQAPFAMAVPDLTGSKIRPSRKLVEYETQ